MKGHARNLVFLIVLFLPNHTLFSQAVTDPEELFSEGEYFFLSEDYEEALYYYRQLLEVFPDQCQLQFQGRDDLPANTRTGIPGHSIP